MVNFASARALPNRHAAPVSYLEIIETVTLISESALLTFVPDTRRVKSVLSLKIRVLRYMKRTGL